MKPSPKLVEQWRRQANTECDRDMVLVGLAELAAQWGAEQAQQAPIEEPELPEPVIAREEYAVGTGEFYTAAQMHDHYQAGVRAGMGDSQWRTIDSAPKDGVKVLAFTNDGYKYPLVCQCVWGDGAWWPDAWESPDEPLKPTHWMPLPTPPAMQGDSQ